MRIISSKALKTFYGIHPDAESSLMAWENVIKKADFKCFQDVRNVYPSADLVGALVIFNIGGNKYRLVTAIHFNRSVIYIREVLTHAEYSKKKFK